MVLIWPSTVIRLKEASTARRSAAPGSSTTASVWTKQSSVAMFGWIIPAPFAWADRVTPSTFSVQRFGQRSVVMIASAKTAPPSAERSLAACSIPGSTRAHRHRHADHAGLGDGHLRGLEAERVGRPFGHRERVGEALLAGLGVGVAGVDHRGADVVLVDDVPADPDRRGGGGVAGEDQRRVDPVGVADEQADVGLAAALQADVDPAGPEAGRELRRVELLDPGGSVDPAGPEEALVLSRRVAH